MDLYGRMDSERDRLAHLDQQIDTTVDRLAGDRQPVENDLVELEAWQNEYDINQRQLHELDQLFPLAAPGAEQDALNQARADLEARQTQLMAGISAGWEHAQGRIAEETAAQQVRVAEEAGEIGQLFDATLADMSGVLDDNLQGLGMENTGGQLGVGVGGSDELASDLAALTAGQGARSEALTRQQGANAENALRQLASMGGMEQSAQEFWLQQAAQQQLAGELEAIRNRSDSQRLARAQYERELSSEVTRTAAALSELQQQADAGEMRPGVVDLLRRGISAELDMDWDEVLADNPIVMQGPEGSVSNVTRDQAMDTITDFTGFLAALDRAGVTDGIDLRRELNDYFSSQEAMDAATMREVLAAAGLPTTAADVERHISSYEED